MAGHDMMVVGVATHTDDFLSFGGGELLEDSLDRLCGHVIFETVENRRSSEVLQSNRGLKSKCRQSELRRHTTQRGLE